MKLKKLFNRESGIQEMSDAESNRFNIKASLFITAVLLFLWVLNLFGVFIVDSSIFIKVVVIDLFFEAVMCVTVKLMGYENKKTKIVLLTALCLQFSLLYMFITYHATLGLIFPLIFSALYRKKWVLWYTYAVNSSCILVSTVLAYIYGLSDANTILTTWTTTENFINDFASYTPITGVPVLNLLLFYAIPRCLMCMSIIPVLLHITVVIDNRTTKLLEEQENNLALSREQQEVQQQIIVSLSSVIESRDQVTGDHIHNTADYVAFLTDKLQQKGEFKDLLTPKYADLAVKAAPLHDVGKIKVQDAILTKPGKLTPEEFEQMKLHTVYGKNIMHDIIGGIRDSEYLETATEMATSHHERYDGKGYPEGLCGEDIPLCARIMAVADVLDALLSKRQYKEAFTLEKTKEIMSEEFGKQFDPVVLTALLDNWDEFVELYQSKKQDKQ